MDEDHDAGAIREAPTRDPRSDRKTTRLEAFSDGVFAIAATLLVLDVRVEQLGPVTNDADLWAGLAALVPSATGVVVSFLVLCMLWWVHARMLADIERVDPPFVALNSLRLLGVVLIPFSTSLSSTYPDVVLGDVLLALNVFAIVLIGGIQTWYATKPGRGLTADIGDAEVRALRGEATSAVILATAVLLLSPILGPLAFLAFVLDPLLSRWLGGRLPSKVVP